MFNGVYQEQMANLEKSIKAAKARGESAPIPCSVCGEPAFVEYPLLKGCPSFCSKHHNQKDAGKYGCDLFSDPDDFDIPDGCPW